MNDNSTVPADQAPNLLELATQRRYRLVAAVHSGNLQDYLKAEHGAAIDRFHAIHGHEKPPDVAED